MENKITLMSGTVINTETPEEHMLYRDYIKYLQNQCVTEEDKKEFALIFFLHLASIDFSGMQGT